MRVLLTLLVASVCTFVSAEAKVSGARKNRATRKVEFKSNVIPLSAFVDQKFDLDLNTILKGPGNGPLTWSTGPDKPAWVVVDSATSRMTGTPSVSDLGTRSFRLSVQDGDSGALGRIDVTVFPPPKWKQNPIDLDVQHEDSFWQYDLTSKVENPGGGKLTFSVADPAKLPQWMTLDAAGILSGTPRRKDVGKYSGIPLVVASDLGGKDTTSAFGEVLITIKPPKWKQKPVIAANANEDFPYSFDLNVPNFISNPEGFNLTFELLSGPASGWVQLTSSGTIFGTPKAKDLGAVTLRVKFTAVGQNVPTDETDVTFQVVHTNHPPQWKLNPINLPDAPVKIPYLQDISLNALDIDGDALTFKKVSGPAWATISAGGVLGGTPSNSDFGLNEWTVEVSDGEFSIPVQVRAKVLNKPPYWNNKPTVLAGAKEDDNYIQNLIPLATDPDGDTLTFTLVSGPSWAKVSPSGSLSGVPNGEVLGLNKFVIRVSDSVSGQDETEVHINVEHVNHAPKWTQNPVILPNAKEKLAYNQSLRSFVVDKDKGDTLTFSKLAGPAWASITPDGQVVGTPGRTDVGVTTISVRVADQHQASDDATIQITVEKTNRPPVWTQDPFDLGETLEDATLNVNVAKYALDPDGDPLTFRKVNGPAWLTVAGDGTTSGTPKRPDAGAYTVVYEVTDGEYTVQAKGNGTVKAKILPPVIHADQLSFIVKERATLNVSLNQSKFVEDPQGLPLSFSVVPADQKLWVTLATNGDMVLKPLFVDIGQHQFRITVTNGKFTVEGLVNVTVVRDPRPPIWLEDPIKFTTLARVPFQKSIADKAKDLDGVAITFEKKSGPAWLTIDSNGKISGTPGDSDVGENKFIVTVKNDVAGADGTLIVTVAPNNHPPTWSQDPITLPTAWVGQVYSQSVAQYAQDVDAGDVLNFVKISGPNWVNVTPNGTITGTPAKTDVGPVTMKVRVSDPSLASADTTVTFVVEKPNSPPVWLQEPVDFGEITQETTLQFNVAKFAFDADNEPLTFKKVSGPGWLFIGTAGDATGTPMAADVGAFNAVLEVSDGKASAQVKAIGKVIAKNHPPVIKVEALVFTVKERQVVNLSLNDPKYVEDIDGNTLTFTLVNKADWITLSGNGDLSMKPVHKDIGNYSFPIKVSDGKATVDGIIQVSVIRDPRPPIWLEDPVRFFADARTPFAANIKDKAKDLDGAAITFEKVDGPAWLSVAADGKISGTPEDANVGENTFTVLAKNEAASTSGKVIVTVRPTNHAPIVHNELLKFTVKEREVLNVNLTDKQYVEDVDNDALSFQGVSSFEWVSLSGDGQLSIKPRFQQIGTHQYKFKVSDGKLGADGVVEITVVRNPRAPVWLEDPVRFDAVSREPFANTLAGKAKDLDGLPITYEKKSGPAWLSVAADGKISGTPQDTDAGDNTFVVTVKNDVLGADGNVIVRVTMGNHPPIIHDNELVFTVKERQVLSINLADKKYIEDVDNDNLTFSWVSGKSWTDLTANGQLTLKPLFADIGSHSFAFKVSDGKLTAQGTIKVRVLRDPRPPIWLEDPIRFEAKTNRSFTANIANKVKELDNVPLTFTKKAGPAWLSIDAQGNLSGTPTDADVGENRFIITASNDGTSSDGNVIVNVVLGNTAPVWLQDPINLGSVEVNKLFSSSLASFAVDKEGDALTFEKLSGPGWVFINPNGAVTGTPGEADVGLTTLRVRVSDPMKLFNDATVNITVTAKPNRPPVWLQDPINLGTALAENAFQFDLAPFAKDPDGDGLTFKKVTGPQWLFVGSNGLIQGRPEKTDVGDYVASFEVSDGKLSALVNAFGSVKTNSNQGPVVKPEAWSFIVKERGELLVNLNQPQYVIDPEGDPLTFQLMNPPSWMTVSGSGQLAIRPLFPHIGDHTFVVQISDNKGNSVQATMFVKVLRDPRPPVWLQNPIRLEAKVHQPFTNTLVDKVQDLDNLPLTFSKVSGPAWLNIAANGIITGTPLTEHLGENSFQVTVRNDLLSAQATLIVTVKNSGPQVDTEQVDKAVTGAPTENLWVIDNSWPWLGQNKMVKQLKDSIGVYFQALEAAGVRSTGLYVSADVTKWKGIPNQGNDTSKFIQWSDPKIVPHFISRVDESATKKCYTSPIWGITKFLEYATGNNEISSRFFTAGTPMDVLIATPHTDYYKRFSAGSPQANYTPNDYTRDFIAFHEKKSQNYRISAIAAECQQLMDPMEESGQNTKENPYRTLTRMTKGDYFAWDCHFDMNKTMRDYAQKVIFRAYAMAKPRIPLSKKPDPTSIQVYIGGVLMGPAVWSYDSARNEVILYWNKIDISVLKPGDLIEIRYNTI